MLEDINIAMLMSEEEAHAKNLKEESPQIFKHQDSNISDNSEFHEAIKKSREEFEAVKAEPQVYEPVLDENEDVQEAII